MYIVFPIFAAFYIYMYCCPQNVMPLSAGVFRSERRNAKPQCPPRLCVQHLTPMRWTRVPDHAQPVEVTRLEERYGWRARCTQIRQIMTLHIPEESRSEMQVTLWRCQIASNILYTLQFFFFLPFLSMELEKLLKD